VTITWQIHIIALCTHVDCLTFCIRVFMCLTHTHTCTQNAHTHVHTQSLYVQRATKSEPHCLYMSVCVRVCVHVRVCVRKSACARAHAKAHAYVCVFVSMCVCDHVIVRVCASTKYPYTHTYTHTLINL